MQQVRWNISMTSSTISSLNDHRDVKALLTSFLEGECTLAELQSALHPGLTVNFDLAPSSRQMAGEVLGMELQIPVRERHLRQMLEQYLSEGISAADLSNWAAFVYGAGVFIPEGETEEERWEAGDGPVWDILQRLMTPDVFDGMDPLIIKQYLAMLVRQH
jgi:hypothetical protein